MNAKTLLKKTYPALLAALITLAFALGTLYSADNRAADALYQSAQALSGNIVLIGIDDASLDELGPYSSWTRDYMALALDALNADPAARPAAIGIDTLYSGENGDSADARLVAAASAGNVVAGCMAVYDQTLIVDESGDFYMDQNHVVGVEYAYDALRAVTTAGHVNAMYDADGVLRHALMSVSDGETEVPSFALALYQMYRQTDKIPDMAETDGFWYVDFASAPGGFDDGYSFANLVMGRLDTSDFADKIVLIGPYAAAFSDSFITSADRGVQMNGVEYQANVLAALLRGEAKREVGTSAQSLLLFVVLSALLYFFRARKVLPCTIVFLGVCLGSLGVCLALYEYASLVLHPLWLPTGSAVAYVGSVGVNYVRAAAEKRRVTNTFKRYVAPEVVRELLKDGSSAVDLGGTLCDIAVLFVDIRGFTTMSEVLTPPQVVEILNQYLTLTTDCVMRNHGTLDKFVGDCTMAIWNAPLAQEDYVYNAVHCAMDMARGAAQLKEKLLAQYGRTVDFGVGVHCGSAVVGNIGSPMRMDFTAIGDTVNTAARLEANAPAGTVYVSRAVCDALGDRIAVTSLGDTIRLKGKAEGFEVLKVDSLREKND